MLLGWWHVLLATRRRTNKEIKKKKKKQHRTFCHLVGCPFTQTRCFLLCWGVELMFIKSTTLCMSQQIKMPCQWSCSSPVLTIQWYNEPGWIIQFSGHWTSIYQHNVQSCGSGANHLLYCCVTLCERVHEWIIYTYTFVLICMCVHVSSWVTI